MEPFAPWGPPVCKVRFGPQRPESNCWAPFYGVGPSMGPRVYRGPLRSLAVEPVPGEPMHPAFPGSVGPAARLPEPVPSGRPLLRDCVSQTCRVYKAMLSL